MGIEVKKELLVLMGELEEMRTITAESEIDWCVKGKEGGLFIGNAVEGMEQQQQNKSSSHY